MAGLGAALASSGLLLGLPPADPGPDPTPAPLAVAWPTAVTAALAAQLPDGADYRPALFLDARTSVGTAQTPDGKGLRLLVQPGNRVLRTLAAAENPSFQTVAAGEGSLAWFERTDSGGLRLWTAPLAGGAARQVTADVGRVRTARASTDLIIADGRARWVAAGKGDTTEVREVDLTTSKTRTYPEQGSWRLVDKDTLVDGVTDTRGATRLRDLTTGTDRSIASTDRAATDCGPSWCRVVSLDDDGYGRIELVRPDGAGRTSIADGTVNSELVDVTPLNRFEVYVSIGANSELTGNAELRVYELATRRTVLVSPDAGQIAYGNGVLSWTTGNLDTFVRHALDLRTVPEQGAQNSDS